MNILRRGLGCLGGAAALACAVIAMLSPPASADGMKASRRVAEVATPEAFTWTGPYIGAHLGWAWADDIVTDFDSYNRSFPNRDFSANADGVFGGFQAGYNWQRGSLVVGIEGEIGWLGLDDGTQDPLRSDRPKNDSFARLETGFYGTIAGRLGFAIDKFMFYLKGGGVLVDSEVSFIDTNPLGLTLVSGTHRSEVLTGGVWGLGMEVPLDRAWSVKFEYLRFDLGDVRLNTVDNLGITRRFRHDVDIDTIKFGLNFKLGAGRDLERAPLK